MKLIFSTVLFIVISAALVVAQENVVVTGKVLDSKTRLPLISANIGLKGKPYNAASDENGSFTLLFPDTYLEDSLFVSYVGYSPFSDKITNIDLTDKVFLLEETPTLLDEITILEKRMYKFELKRMEASFKLIKGNLYAFDAEVTNREYNQFLAYLLKSNQVALYKKYKPDIRGYEGSILQFFKLYHLELEKTKESKYDTDYGNYPVVNITYEAALAYCEWFAGLYNGTKGKKKFSKVMFRLPTLKEWRIAALGYPKFQSWNVEENTVEVGVPRYPGEEAAYRKRMVPVEGNELLYPWYYSFDYRNKAQNKRNCWLANVKVPDGSIPCIIEKASGDSFPVTAPVRSYFRHGFGLYDISGNVAEMTDEKGKACGGSWNHSPAECTITSINKYSGPDGAIGFRVFMEVIEEK